MRLFQWPPLALAFAALALPTGAGAQTATLVRFDTTDVAEPGARRHEPFLLHDIGILMPQPPDTNVPATPKACAASGLPPTPSAAFRASGRRSIYRALIRSSECEAGLPIGLMDSLVHVESNYDATAVSRAGAAGLAQLMPATASALGVNDRFDPETSVRAGAHYLRNLLRRFKGDVPLALAAYNAGPGAVQRARGIPLNGETPGYVSRVLRLWTHPTLEGSDIEPSARQLAASLGFLPQGGS